MLVFVSGLLRKNRTIQKQKQTLFLFFSLNKKKKDTQGKHQNPNDLTSKAKDDHAAHLAERTKPWTWSKSLRKTDKEHPKTRPHSHFKPFTAPQVACKTAWMLLSTSILANKASQSLTKAKAKFGPKNSLDFQNDPGKSVASWPRYKAARPGPIVLHKRSRGKNRLWIS